jgi:hypothetical protein
MRLRRLVLFRRSWRRRRWRRSRTSFFLLPGLKRLLLLNVSLLQFLGLLLMLAFEFLCPRGIRLLLCHSLVLEFLLLLHALPFLFLLSAHLLLLLQLFSVDYRLCDARGRGFRLRRQLIRMNRGGCRPGACGGGGALVRADATALTGTGEA